MRYKQVSKDELLCALECCENGKCGFCPFYEERDCQLSIRKAAKSTIMRLDNALQKYKQQKKK